MNESQYRDHWIRFDSREGVFNIRKDGEIVGSASTLNGALEVADSLADKGFTAGSD
jgi:hypothetical protein